MLCYHSKFFYLMQAALPSKTAQTVRKTAGSAKRSPP
ncbi:hypothetical protein BACCAP_00137 [Pseudoflavonifractor capillosus ATCC 29799]|uniref:Uncharacterized protein n=1 Tax=Pseudoflavonifractor capillosus ATCC 29799 TaxID=411467 RepID=A6NPM1_9FIRM|nr:hypothetical protein BACCAP_00137 [Pseudoflavonifractor capillosus ATCC 29799]